MFRFQCTASNRYSVIKRHCSPRPDLVQSVVVVVQVGGIDEGQFRLMVRGSEFIQFSQVRQGFDFTSSAAGRLRIASQ